MHWFGSQWDYHGKDAADGAVGGCATRQRALRDLTPQPAPSGGPHLSHEARGSQSDAHVHAPSPCGAKEWQKRALRPHLDTAVRQADRPARPVAADATDERVAVLAGAYPAHPERF